MADRISVLSALLRFRCTQETLWSWTLIFPVMLARYADHRFVERYLRALTAAIRPQGEGGRLLSG